MSRATITIEDTSEGTSVSLDLGMTADQKDTDVVSPAQMLALKISKMLREQPTGKVG